MSHSLREKTGACAMGCGMVDPLPGDAWSMCLQMLTLEQHTANSSVRLFIGSAISKAAYGGK